MVAVENSRCCLCRLAMLQLKFSLTYFESTRKIWPSLNSNPGAAPVPPGCQTNHRWEFLRVQQNSARTPCCFTSSTIFLNAVVIASATTNAPHPPTSSCFSSRTPGTLIVELHFCHPPCWCSCSLLQHHLVRMQAEDTGSSLSRTTSPLWVIGADLCPAVWNLSPFFESNAQEAICHLPALPLWGLSSLSA